MGSWLTKNLGADVDQLFLNFSLVLVIAVAIGAVGTALRQPLIVSFIVVGVLVGPSGWDLVSRLTHLELLAESGIAILLFLVGLRLDLEIIRNLGPVATATGLGQVVFTSAIGFLLCLGLGYVWIESLYIAVALTFSSTIIIVKLLSDKHEIDSLHGRIAVGFLIVQDLVVILVMIGLSGLGGSQEAAHPLWAAMWVACKGLLFLATVVALAWFVMPRFVMLMARSQELVTLFAIAWALGLASLCLWLGLSKEVGAFLAGVSLASTPVRDSIGGRLTGVRDFLLLFFFINLGAGLNFSVMAGQAWSAALLSLFVLIGNPLIVIAIMGWMGYRRRTGFLSGLAVAQISEFSLILGALGVSLGHIAEEAMGLITLVGLITIGLSTYMILYSHPLYDRLANWLGVFERKAPASERQHDSEPLPRPEIIVFGLGRYGSQILHYLRQSETRTMGIDFDPRAVAKAKKMEYYVQYGDAEDPDFALSLPLSGARWVVCTPPSAETNLSLLRVLKAAGFTGKIALTAHHADEAPRFKRAGADLVLTPFVDAAKEAVDNLREQLSSAE